MVDFFLALLGRYAQIFIAWYMRHDFLLSSIIVVYGLVLLIAKRNTTVVEERLKLVLGADTMLAVWEHIEKSPLSDAQLASLRAGLFLPIVPSRNHFIFFPITNKSLLKLLRPRSKKA
jgi:hypothetical protein